MIFPLNEQTVLNAFILLKSDKNIISRAQCFHWWFGYFFWETEPIISSYYKKLIKKNFFPKISFAYPNV
jgi:hypothetical protein